MAPTVSGLSRAALLKALRAARAPVTPTQLVRWTHAGWVNSPEIKGLGRGRGVEASYPPVAFWECYFLAPGLRHTRLTIDEAGWCTWVLGLGPPDAVRRFLLNKLRAQLEAAELVVRPGRHASFVKRALRQVSRSREFEALRHILGPEDTERAVRVIARAQAGSPVGPAEAMTPDAWEDFRDALVTPLWKDLRKGLSHVVSLPENIDEHLPAPEDMETIVAEGLPIRPLIAAIENCSDRLLRVLANEAQLVLEELSAQPTLLSPDAFLYHLRNHFFDPVHRAAWAALRRERGWSAPPPPPLFRWPAFAALVKRQSTKPGVPDAAAR